MKNKGRHGTNPYSQTLLTDGQRICSENIPQADCLYFLTLPENNNVMINIQLSKVFSSFCLWISATAKTLLLMTLTHFHLFWYLTTPEHLNLLGKEWVLPTWKTFTLAWLLRLLTCEILFKVWICLLYMQTLDLLMKKNLCTLARDHMKHNHRIAFSGELCDAEHSTLFLKC